MLFDKTISDYVERTGEKYRTQIDVSIAGTKVYGIYNGIKPAGINGIYKGIEPEGVKGLNCDMEILIEDLDASDAVMKFGGASAAVLNFASYSRPGSTFLLGGLDQESDLCKHSFLYNVLRQCPDYYQWNCVNVNRGMGRKHALYTPYVIFEKDGEHRRIDVISCSIQNWAVARTYGITNTENVRELKERISFVLKIAEENGIKRLILGAWGCGSFGQNATTVAKAFADVLCNHRSFSQVIFAIPNYGDDNLERFRSVFSHYSILKSR